VDHLVAFVADPAEDRHAEALREAARSVRGAGFFDDPDGGAERTAGVYVRAAELAEPAAGALLEAVFAISARLAVRLEVQHREEVLGYITSGEPDVRLGAALTRASRLAGDR
jgi:hypothetical protein